MLMRKTALTILILTLAIPFAAAMRGPKIPIYNQIAGELREVKVEAGDTLYAISARHGVSVSNIMRDNNIRKAKDLTAGTSLTIDTRSVIPAATDNGLVADIAAGTLYRFGGGQLLSRHPAGYGTKGRPTPIGTFSILFIDQNMQWGYPRGIEEEREREGYVARMRTPPEPSEPLGPYWVQLSTWGLGIHATPFPSTIGNFMSHQQIRLSGEELKNLVPQLGAGMRLEAIYFPARLAMPPDGSIWLEVHEDIYGLGMPTNEIILSALGDRATEADHAAIEKVLEEKRGVAYTIHLASEEIEAGSNGSYRERGYASWSCIDCPPGEKRRVTLQLKAREDLTIEGAFPLEVLDASGKIVYSSDSSSKENIAISKGETRNFVWDLVDTDGQSLPPGSYTARIYFRPGNEGEASLALPIWVDK